MISLFSGTPGSGKSLHMAKEIYYYCNSRKPRLVIANFEVDRDELKHPERFFYVPNLALKTPEIVIMMIEDYFCDNDLKENSVIIFIDECQILFNARQWRETSESGWLPFFSQHRKYGCNIYLIAQFDEMIDKQIRNLIEYEIVHRKITNFGFVGMFFKLITFGDIFVAVERWYTINQKTGQEFFKARRKYFELYDTFNTFES